MRFVKCEDGRWVNVDHIVSVRALTRPAKWHGVPETHKIEIDSYEHVVLIAVPGAEVVHSNHACVGDADQAVRRLVNQLSGGLVTDD